MRVVRISVVVVGFFAMILGSVIVGSHVVWSQEPTATAVPTPTATPTVDPEVQFRADKVVYCIDSVHYYYLSRTGIELTVYGVTYVVTDSGAEVTGKAVSRDERFTGPLDFKCVFEDFMDVPMMLTEIIVTGE